MAHVWQVEKWDEQREAGFFAGPFFDPAAASGLARPPPPPPKRSAGLSPSPSSLAPNNPACPSPPLLAPPADLGLLPPCWSSLTPEGSLMSSSKGPPVPLSSVVLPALDRVAVAALEAALDRPVRLTASFSSESSARASSSVEDAAGFVGTTFRGRAAVDGADSCHTQCPSCWLSHTTLLWADRNC